MSPPHPRPRRAGPRGGRGRGEPRSAAARPPGLPRRLSSDPGAAPGSSARLGAPHRPGREASLAGPGPGPHPHLPSGSSSSSGRRRGLLGPGDGEGDRAHLPTGRGRRHSGSGRRRSGARISGNRGLRCWARGSASSGVAGRRGRGGGRAPRRSWAGRAERRGARPRGPASGAGGRGRARDNAGLFPRAAAPGPPCS